MSNDVGVVAYRILVCHRHTLPQPYTYFGACSSG